MSSKRAPEYEETIDYLLLQLGQEGKEILLAVIPIEEELTPIQLPQAEYQLIESAYRELVQHGTSRLYGFFLETGSDRKKLSNAFRKVYEITQQQKELAQVSLYPPDFENLETLKTKLETLDSPLDKVHFMAGFVEDWILVSY